MTSLDSTVSAAVAIVVLALATLYLTRRLFFRQNLPLPPGPKPVPLIGNLLDMPRSNEWECFAEWARQYGDIVHCRIFGRHMVILNSFEAATELLDKRSLIYSDRPLFPMGDLVSMREFNFGFMEYGKEWQIRRRTYTDLFSKSSPEALEPHRAATLHMVKQLFQDPKNWEEHLRLHPAQVMLDVTYGLDIFSRDHPVIRTVEEAMSTVVDVILRPEWWIVNPVHILKGWPTVLGGGFVKLKIEKWRKQFVALREVPWQEGKKSVRPSFITEINGDLAKESKDRQETLLKDCAGVAYGAGVETSYSYSSIFVLTMLLNPSVQKKAQDELDAVIGHSQLPQLTDRPHLPYVSALIKEVIRWHAVLPQGIPHEARQDDIYRGYFIPKGTMVISNIWHILRDPSVYPDPDKFDPGRFLQGGTFVVGDNDPSRVAFGFGRRICPGKAFAEDALFHVVTYILTLFCIEPSEDTPKDPALLRRFSSGATSYALPFSCHFVVRSEEAKRFLMS